jgi:alpha-tubulin suppressor-like RCC1 family protein
MPNIKKMMMAAAGASGGSSGPSSGQLWTWGRNSHGQLGLGDTTHRSEPAQVGSDTDWEKGSVSGGLDGSRAIKTNDTLWSWGRNNSGQLGLGDTTSRSSPVQVGSLTNWFLVGGGDHYNVAIKTDGTLWSWGNNYAGKLGLGDTTNRSSPVQVGSLTNWKGSTNAEVLDDGHTKLGVGGSSWLAIKSDGTLWGCGRNNYWTLGDNSNTDRSSPVQIGSGTDWASVSPAFGSHNAAIKTDGTLWSWGYNPLGNTGHGDTTDRSSPVQVGSLTDWKFVCCGGYYTLAVKTNGTLWAWGYNANGRLGTGNTTTYSSPVQVGSLTNWLRPMITGDSSRVLKTDGTLWAWGGNQYGILGLGDEPWWDYNARSSPVQMGTSTWATMLSGGYHTAAVSTED